MKNKPYYLSVCAVVLDEAKYITEWLEFNRLEGVEHFFIYDNGSTDGTHEILNKYKEKGIVTWEENKEKPIQFVAYNDCLKFYGQESEWIAFLDTDEFLFCTKIRLDMFLHNFKDEVGAVAARWWLYGSNGNKVYDNRLVTERFLRKSPLPDKHVKSIVRTDAAISVGRNPHVFYLKDGFVAVDENGTKLPIEYAIMEGETANLLRIAHFHTKSENEYMVRKLRPDPGTNVIRPPERVKESFLAHDHNEIFDASAAKHVNEILKRIT